MSEAYRNSLYDYCERMSMSYSYKPVLILALLSNDGRVSLDDAANYFLDFYGKRLELGLVAEKPNSIYSNLKCTFELVKQNIRTNPVKALLNSSNLFAYEKKNEILEIVPSCWNSLSTSDKECVASICNERLEKYFAVVTRERLSDITCFSRPQDVNGFLSNDYLSRFSLHGESFISVSQYLLFRQALLAGDENRKKQIMSQNTSDSISTLKVYLPTELKTLWTGQMQIIAYQALITKFAQDEKLGIALLDTGSSIIAACLSRDTIWGNGLEPFDPAVTNVSLWPGQNLLGYSLMQVRNMLFNTRRF